MKYKVIFMDTETTGVNTTDYLCQLAYKTGDEIFCELYKPPIRIPAEASAVTHISNKMVANKPAFQESPSYNAVKSMLEDENSIMVAHNAKFDVGMIRKEGIEPKNVICTLRLARALDTENKLPQHKLQFLRYYLDIDIEAQAHDALGDVLVLEKLFERLFDKIKNHPTLPGTPPPQGGDQFTDEEVLQQMLDISARPSLMHSFSFGKYNGKTVAEVAGIDRGYLEWFLNSKEKDNPDDEDWIYTLRYYLGK
ncbi:MAG: exonuclease domain-containing protein [Minisyncoccia bacterium]